MPIKHLNQNNINIISDVCYNFLNGKLVYYISLGKLFIENYKCITLDQFSFNIFYFFRCLSVFPNYFNLVFNIQTLKLFVFFYFLPLHRFLYFYLFEFTSRMMVVQIPYFHIEAKI